MRVLLVLLSLFSLYCVASQVDQLRLIETSDGERRWMTHEQLMKLIDQLDETNKIAVGFFDVTDFQDISSLTQPKRFAFPSSPSQQTLVNSLLPELKADNLKDVVTTLSSYHSRYYTMPEGTQSAEDFLAMMDSIAKSSGRNDVECEFFNHTHPQPSVICRILGTGSLAEQVVVVGAHFDSINSRDTSGYAPGADDDASGVASFVETFRVLIESGFQPKRTIEFMAYAAEEVGLRGSQDIANTYASQNKTVYAVYQNEMSGYTTGTPQITILQDYVDADLTLFTEKLVDTYCDIGYTRAICGYGCSDHASWERVGFATVCTAEAGPFGNVNPNMHTAQDTVDKLDFEFGLEFTKLCLAWTVELSLFE